jgi:hypothetical protein
MKHKVIRFFLDFTKEEQWLNEMAAKGLQLISVSAPQYVFEEGMPGEYIYRLELLEKAPGSAEGRTYLSFVEEPGGIGPTSAERPPKAPSTYIQTSLW